MLFCSQCGAKLESTAAFCSQCGAKVNQKEPLSPPPKEEGFTFHSDSLQPPSPAKGADRFSFDDGSPHTYQSYLDEDDGFSFAPQRDFDSQGLEGSFSPNTYGEENDPIAYTPIKKRDPSASDRSPVRHRGSAKKKTGVWITILVCVLAAIAVGGGIFLFTRGDENVSPDELYGEALLSMENGDYEQAEENLLTVLSKNPQDVNAYLQLAQCYVQMDRKERAVEILEAGYAQTRDGMLTDALAELGVESEPPASSPPPSSIDTTPPPETEPTTPVSSEEPPKLPANIDLGGVLLGSFSRYEDSFGELRKKESTADPYVDQNGNQAQRELTTYTYDSLVVSTQNGTIVNIAANFTGDVPFHIFGLGKGTTYNQTLNALGTPETATGEGGYDTLVYLADDGRAVKFYFKNDVLALANVFLGVSQNG